ncbi:MAG: hypothetical protein KDF64_05575 [Geminicoccaceae bacterium]|nr:hypothetical protein [Geminicoccaceae bacterium]
MRLHTEVRRTCLAYSPGGHYAELMRALDGIDFTDRFDATFASVRAVDPAARRTYHLCHPRRSPARLALNIAQTLFMLLRERPALVISSGADVAVASVILARLMGATAIFIESSGSVRPTLAGRLVYPFCHLFIVQWPEQLDAFPKAILARGILA